MKSIVPVVTLFPVSLVASALALAALIEIVVALALAPDDSEYVSSMGAMGSSKRYSSSVSSLLNGAVLSRNDVLKLADI